MNGVGGDLRGFIGVLKGPLECLANRRSGIGVGQPVVHPPTVLARKRKARIGKDGEMARDRARCELQEFDQLAGTALTTPEGAENAQTTGVGEGCSDEDHVVHFVISRNDEMRGKENLADNPNDDGLEILPFVAVDEGQRVLRGSGPRHDVGKNRHQRSAEAVANLLDFVLRFQEGDRIHRIAVG